MKQTAHWDHVHGSKSETQVTWYQPHLERSLALLEEAGLRTESRVIDVGGGTSTLVDDLLAREVEDVTVVDLSRVALEQARARLGPATEQVQWLTGNITTVELPPDHFDLWHDRAVFHFLTDPADRRRYLDSLGRSLRQGGHMILCTFAEDGPRRCSGLETMRYGPEDLAAEVGPGFTLIRTEKERHATPWGREQLFRYFLLQAADRRG